MAVPSIESIPLIVQRPVVNVLTPEFLIVRLLKVTAFPVNVCEVPFNITVPVPAVYEPLFVKFPPNEMLSELEFSDPELMEILLFIVSGLVFN